MNRMQGDHASPVPPGEQDAGLTVLGKTCEFFQICDLEGKGFITCQDMQRLHCQPLSLEELEEVVVTLDADGNGLLTLKECTTGFSEFRKHASCIELDSYSIHSRSIIKVVSGCHLQQIQSLAIPPAQLLEPCPETQMDVAIAFLFAGSAASEVKRLHVLLMMQQPEGETVCQLKCKESMSDDEDEFQFSNPMDLGAKKVFDDENDVKQLRLQLRKGGSRLLSSFEEFLVRTFSRLQEADNEKNKLECALEKNPQNQNASVSYNTFFSFPSQLEQHCAELLSSKEEIKVENTKPKRTNQELQRDLERKSHKLSQAQKQWQVLQEEASRLHEEKEIDVHVTETLQRQKSGLLKQLDFLSCGLVGSLIVIDSLPLIDLCAGACENSLVNYLTIVSAFQDYSLIFRERSAYSGYNTKKSVLHFARILKEHEDKDKEKTTKLQAGMNKRSCCIRP
ncbi:LOW QUALITY PROTEIN: EF-hand calcium-binding domain-containing protein 4B [Guaruba guarouba]